MQPLKYAYILSRIIKIDGMRSFFTQLQYDLSHKLLPNFLLDRQYKQWIRNNELKYLDSGKYGEKSDNFSLQPKISIITPVWNVEEALLVKMIDSVLNQTYQNWELCIAEGNSEKVQIRKILEDYSTEDPRIKVKLLTKNYGISENSNEALSLASGEFVVLLDHDDTLAPFALYEIVKEINEKPSLDLIYSDKDKIDKYEKRTAPFFKPDWSPDLFFSLNYICHLTAIRKGIIDEIGGFRRGYDGAQDYDLFLRIIEKLHPDNIGHICKILYHWRIHLGSTANSLNAKPNAVEAGKRALTDSLMRRRIDGEVLDGFFYGSYRVKYHISDYPKIAIIIPSKDHIPVLKKCVESILTRTRYENYEIVIIDNQSNESDTFSYYQILKKNPKIRVLNYNKPFNYSAINNYGISVLKSEIIVLLNNDTEVIAEDWLLAMLEHAKRPEVGAVGAKLLYRDDTIQHAGVILGIKGRAGHSHRGYPTNERGYFGRINLIGNCSAVTGACIMMRKEIFDEVGGFDETLSYTLNDVDLCLKIRNKGYLIVYTPYAALYHYEHLTRGLEITPETREQLKDDITYLKKKWGKIFEEDPYYNQNLTRDREDFSLKI